MSERSIHEFADKQGPRRRVIHSPGALETWEKVAAKLDDRKAALIEGQLIVVSHYVKKTWRKLRPEDTKLVKANWERENAEN